MPSQAEKAAQFAALHIKGDPIILFNIWDAGSAVTVQDAGANALATGSHPLANAIGHEDGEAAPLDDMLWMLKRICASTTVPVSHDTERGYGNRPDDVAATCRKVMAAGAIGVNIEDSLGDGALREMDKQAARFKAAKTAMTEAVPGAWLNARTDVFMAMRTASTDEKIAAVAARGAAYKAAGADSLFVPFLRDLDVIAQVCAASPLPVNVMRAVDGPSLAEYAATGVARISHGPGPRATAMAALSGEAKRLYG